MLNTITLGTSTPSIRAEITNKVVVGPGHTDRWSSTTTVELDPEGLYLLVRDARYRGRGPGAALVRGVEAALGQPAVVGYSGHPDHDGTWALWRLDGVSEIDCPSVSAPRVIRLGAEPSIEGKAVRL